MHPSPSFSPPPLSSSSLAVPDTRSSHAQAPILKNLKGEWGLTSLNMLVACQSARQSSVTCLPSPTATAKHNHTAKPPASSIPAWEPRHPGFCRPHAAGGNAVRWDMRYVVHIRWGCNNLARSRCGTQQVGPH
jgi:hypothetical protein